MIPGPLLIYKCPSCDKLYSNDSIITGNTFGAEYYSDGKQIAPSLPKFPSVIKCDSCKSFLWLNKSTYVGNHYGDPENTEWLKAPMAEFLSVYEYAESLSTKFHQNQKEERFLRLQLFWRFNDRIRNGDSLYNYAEDKTIWTDNLNRLLEILDQYKQDDLILIAEIHRNLGEFDRCFEILSKIEDPELTKAKALMARECKRENQAVVLLER